MVKRLDTALERLIREKEENHPEDHRVLKILHLYIDHSPCWDSLRCKDGRYIYVSPGVKLVTGYEPDEFYENPKIDSKIIHPDFLRLWENHQHRQTSKEEKVFLEFKIITKEGEERWINHFCERIRDVNSEIDLIRSSNIDISRIKMREMLIKEKSNTDPLTGLFNRRFLTDYAPKEMWIISKWGYNFVAIGDIDDFKKINDTYGHEAGDEVLKAIAKIIISNLREGDIAVRWGGEEFLLLLHDVSSSAIAYEIVERLRANVEKEVTWHQDKNLKVTISFGVARCKGKEEFSKAIKEADKRLYLAKNAGKNRVIATG